MRAHPSSPRQVRYQTRRRLASLLIGASLTAGAQRPDMQNREFASAALAVTLFDLLSERCSNGSAFTSAQHAQVQEWTSSHRVELVRSRMREFAQHSADRTTLDDARRTLAGRFPMLGATACGAAVSLIRLPDSKFATARPELLRALGATAAETAMPVAPSPPAPPAAPTLAGAVAETIDRFGFSTRPTMGVGGFLTLKIFPVVLFRDGTALTDVQGLSFPDGLAAHRAANSSEWTRWRRQGGAYQLLKDGTWTKLAFQQTYAALPADFRLAGRYRKLSGAGTLAIGGSQSVSVVSEYLFSGDGRVVKSGVVGATGGAGDIGTAISQVQPSERGRYRIDGVTLVIRWDDGSEQRRILVTDPTDPKSAIWLDGTGYVRR
jgi:hypothetical protein